MDRRAFIGRLALGTVAVPRAARAQPARKVYRIGIIGLGPTSDMAGPQPTGLVFNALVRGLRELGCVYGRDFVTSLAGVRASPSVSPTWPPNWSVCRWT